ncbi:MAG TPA: family 2 glycosyl transferase, partial [Actinobacteria bacterium]|nr:family 2 glycosyl transferase [Actinomycetota bacterium]
MTEPTPVAAETPMVPAGTDSPLPRHRDVVSDVVNDLVNDDDWDGDDSFLADGPQQPESVDEHLDLSVAAVVVAHDGLKWLPIVVAAIRGQERPVQRLIVVDTGSRDGGPDLLARELPATDVVTMPRTTSFADAVTAGVARAGAHDFLWLLHDDSAPRTDALLHLVDAAVRSGAAVIGPKVLGWSDRTHLLEIGVSIGLGGRRETGLERGERDQGQHDRDADVLAVGSAGMLVRSEVWHGLDGFDAQFPLFREDVDFGWRANAAGYRVTIAPRAVVHHAEAATRGLRRADAVGGHPQRADRLHAMRIVLANCTTWQLPLVAVGLVLLCIVRTLTLLVGKDVKSAREEAQALRLLVTHPGLVRDARAARSAARIVPAAEVAPLIAPPWAPVRTAIDAVSALVGSSGAGTERPSVMVETGPGSDDAMEALVDGGPSVVGRLMRRRGSIVLVFLLTLSLLAGRGIIGAGRAQGGALLPAPGGFADLWSSFLAAWHPVSVGSSLPASPATALLAALSIAFAGSASAVVDALLILAVPMSFVSAHLSMRGVVRNPWVKIWASLSYALIPALTVSVRDGRVGTVVLAVLFPPLVRAAVHLIGKGAAPAGDRAPWATGLLLAAAGAFAPIVWVVAAVCAVVAGMTIIRDKATRLAMVIALAVPLVVWVPWSFTLLAHPQQFLLEAGVPAGGPPPVAF